MSSRQLDEERIFHSTDAETGLARDSLWHASHLDRGAALVANLRRASGRGFGHDGRANCRFRQSRVDHPKACVTMVMNRHA